LFETHFVEVTCFEGEQKMRNKLRNKLREDVEKFEKKMKYSEVFENVLKCCE